MAPVPRLRAADVPAAAGIDPHKQVLADAAAIIADSHMMCAIARRRVKESERIIENARATLWRLEAAMDRGKRKAGSNHSVSGPAGSAAE